MNKLLTTLLVSILHIISTKREINFEFEKYKHQIREKIIRNSIYCEDYTKENSENANFLNYLEDEKLDMEIVRLLRTISPHDSPSRFFCDKYKTNIRDFPKNAESDMIPWSGFYWPIKTGVISARYCNNEHNSIRDQSTRKVFTWKQSVNHYLQPEEHNEYSYSANYEEYVNNYYSPSEKYDLLVGDNEFTLTNMMKSEGNEVQKDKNGDVPEWMGICHGWSPASYLSKAPKKSIKVLAYDNKTMIEFLPDDIKAIATLFWAETRYQTKFIGGRCIYNDIKEIPKDTETGLWLEDSCYSINPAAFFIVMGNQIGIRKQNLIFDPQVNGEIWNQPVYGYSIKYFNLLDDVNHENASTAKVPISFVKSLNNTLFNYMISKKNKRSEFYLGVNMTVNFVFENHPVHDEKQQMNNNQNIDYSFILELDQNEDIVGGEWLDNFHPNFMWTLDENDIKNRYDVDILAESFSGDVDELKKIRPVAIEASRRKKVLKAIIDYLIKSSAE